jgi:tetratricopeptide (TPR) repeat protein
MKLTVDKIKTLPGRTALIYFIFLLLVSCKVKNKNISPEDINSINLKKGEVVQCGPPEKQFGSVDFELSCSKEIRDNFNLAVALLHSFEYDESEKVFAKIIDKEPGCAMAYWGVAMCNNHALWAPPSQAELEKGSKSIAIALSIPQKSKRESGYIEAIASFYENWDKADHHTRSIRYEKAMNKLHTEYPNDKEAAIFYALALDGAADPTDKSFANQREAGAILNAIYLEEPNHPGIVHYIIHSYDYPELAALALPAARKYASIAPSSAHALHMPSHIFTRLGLWDECIQSNLASTSSARCYAENAGIKGHWDEELHSIDYLVYAYLQKADNKLAKEQWNYLKTINEVYPVSFKDAYAYAAVPARYLLENKLWKEAASLEIQPAAFPWERFPWESAIFHFTRVLGSVHIGNMDSAKSELEKLQTIHETLSREKELYKANQVEIQIRAANAWILFKEGKNNEALESMRSSANMEDATGKSPVTPGEVLPARELLGDMLLQMGNAGKALEAYQESLKNHPNRFNSLYGAGMSAEKSGDPEKARTYYKQLSDICSINSSRPDLASARLFLRKQ